MSTLPRLRATNAGFSLVELMVSMVIALVLTLVISRVLIDHEGTKRTTTTLNDANQNGALAAYELDRAIRSAGSGFVQGGLSTVGDPLGCRINASRNNAIILPRPTAFPEPFALVDRNVRIAPVIIQQGPDSDVLTVLAGTAGFAEVGRAVKGVTTSGTSGAVQLANTLGWRPDDVLLLTGSGSECMLQQVGAVTAGADDNLPLAGTYFSSTGANTSLANYESSFAIALGNISTDSTRNNPPEFKLFGVNPAQRTLVVYDMLTDGTDAAPIPLADGVVAFRALYGVDSNLDGVRDSWQPATGDFASTDTALLAGTAAAQGRLRQIVAVRIGMVMRTSLLEKNAVYEEDTELKFLDDAFSYKVTGEDRFARHRTVEITIPLRNALLVNTP